MGFFRKMTEEEHPKPAQELVELRAAVQKAQLPEAVAAIAAKELERLDKTDASVAEYTIGINYLDYLISLPWNRFTEDNLDLKRAERILESQHYGLPSRQRAHPGVSGGPHPVQCPDLPDPGGGRRGNRPDQPGIYPEKRRPPGDHRGQWPGSPGKGQGPGVRRRSHRSEDGEDGRHPAAGIRQADRAPHRNRHGHRLRHGELRGGRPEKGRGPLLIQAHQTR